MHIPEGFSQVFPYLFVEDADTYVAFLIAGLGGVEVGRTVDPNGRVANCQVRFGTATIMVSEASAAYPSSQAAMYIYVEDADSSMQQALDAGAKLQMKVADMSYGDRQGGIMDPAGNIWWITQRISPEPYYSD